MSGRPADPLRCLSEAVVVSRRQAERCTMTHILPWGDPPDAPDHSSPTSRDIRWSLVLRTRRKIEQGMYDTPETFDAALDAMYDSRAGDPFL